MNKNGKRGGPLNPFRTYDTNFKQNIDAPYEAFRANVDTGADDIKKREAMSNIDPVPVVLPPHLFLPEDSQSLSIRRTLLVAPAGSGVILSYVAREGELTKFLKYAVFIDSATPTSVLVTPLVNGQRVLPLHGDPQNNFSIGLGMGTNLLTENLVECQLDLQPTQVLSWVVTNNGAGAATVGVRMDGYVSQSIIRKITRFGG